MEMFKYCHTSTNHMNPDDTPIGIQPSQDDTEEARKAKFWKQYADNPMFQRVLHPEKSVEDVSPASPISPALSGSPVVYDVFTPVSPDYMKFPSVVKWCSDRCAVPVSPRECFVNRIARNGENDTDKTQFTRCAVLYTIVDGKIVALFDDVVVPDENVVLKYFGEGVADHGFGDFVLPRKDSIIKNAIDRALADNRILSLEGRTNNYTRHSLVSDIDGCEYERVLTPIVGREVALGYVEFLRGRKENYSAGGIWLLTPQNLKSQNLNDTIIVARLFRVGGVGNVSLGSVDAGSSFGGSGR